jgi:Zn-finger nucleic acid-binding protein
MNCPICNVPLQLAVRQEVEIDYCQKCRGVWLDRGELDKLIERSTAAPFSAPREDQEYKHSDSRENRHNDDRNYDKQGKRRKRSFLGDLFDFGD